MRVPRFADLDEEVRHMMTTIQTLPLVMPEEEAMRIAGGYRNPFVKMMAGKKKINLRLMYLENRYYIYEITYHKSPIASLLGKEEVEKRQKIRIMVDATTCSASYTSDPIATVKRETDDLSVQGSYYDDQRLEDCGANMAKRMVRRRVGKQISIRALSMEKVYRPFYIAVYGDMKEGTKARYLPIAADGNEINTTL